MMERNGGPAFPETPLSDGHPGMTLLDYFAGQALAGEMGAYLPEMDPNYEPNAVATRCYRYAAAMLAAREETGNVQEAH